MDFRNFPTPDPPSSRRTVTTAQLNEYYPKLPDWAIIDLRTPPGSRFPGKVVDANFFGEDWTLRESAEGR